MKRKRRPKRKPGGVPPPHRPNETRDQELIARSHDPKLAVDLPSDPRLAFAEIVFRQLAPFLTKSQVYVLLNGGADDAQQLANQRHEPVALVDETGKVLAFRTPQ